jgi:hypothetical protein
MIPALFSGHGNPQHETKQQIRHVNFLVSKLFPSPLPSVICKLLPDSTTSAPEVIFASNIQHISEYPGLPVIYNVYPEIPIHNFGNPNHCRPRKFRMADLYDKVNTHYSSIAREDGKDNADHIKKVALAFGYDPEDLAAIPDGANLGVSCGNPLTVASLKEVSRHFDTFLPHDDVSNLHPM